ncbi:MAG: hypothetical protein H7335_13280 [Massilia sp.]|nr:hypothetical protein [Massilia sp.]
MSVDEASAVVGFSFKLERASPVVATYLQAHGYRGVLDNPVYARAVFMLYRTLRSTPANAPGHTGKQPQRCSVRRR